jgi:NAD(P) transhydrogenase subunit beta
MTNLLYLVASCLFIFGLKELSSPRTAPRGNAVAAVGMLIAAVATVMAEQHGRTALVVIAVGLIVGAVAGIIAAQKVRMTAMPQMVALLNGFGGAASALVAGSELSLRWADPSQTSEPVFLVASALTTLIGWVTFTGSVVAWAKLEEVLSGKPFVYPFQKSLNFVLLVAAVALCVWTFRDPSSVWAFVLLSLVSSVLGVLSVLPIGGADMPVVISLLNSYSGLAAATAGFVLHNNALIIGGALVGASGIILTQIMCKAMNRSLANVLFGAFGQGAGGASAAGAGAGAGATAAEAAKGAVKSGSPDEAAIVLEGASSVIFVPGYGMAVAQAQHAVRELADELQKRGADVKYAIHPVAGRMPGHMNVLLAEADVPYDQLFEMDQINPAFAQSDVALVIGANDVTNPAARHDASSPIYGMPILDVDKARAVMVLKRSMNPGFAGIENELYYRDNTMMVFGDAKQTVTKITTALKEL